MKTQTEIRKEIARLIRFRKKKIRHPEEYDIVARDLNLRVKTLDWVLGDQNG